MDQAGVGMTTTHLFNSGRVILIEHGEREIP
jgi:hypothetical protein